DRGQRKAVHEIDRIGRVTEGQQPARQERRDLLLERNGAGNDRQRRQAPRQHAQVFGLFRNGEEQREADERGGGRESRRHDAAAQRRLAEQNAEQELEHDRAEQDGPGRPVRSAQQRQDRDDRKS